jgi:hypothetical protein
MMYHGTTGSWLAPAFFCASWEILMMRSAWSWKSDFWEGRPTFVAALRVRRTQTRALAAGQQNNTNLVLGDQVQPQIIPPLVLGRVGVHNRVGGVGREPSDLARRLLLGNVLLQRLGGNLRDVLNVELL